MKLLDILDLGGSFHSVASGLCQCLSPYLSQLWPVLCFSPRLYRFSWTRHLEEFPFPFYQFPHMWKPLPSVLCFRGWTLRVLLSVVYLDVSLFYLFPPRSTYFHSLELPVCYCKCVAWVFEPAAPGLTSMSHSCWQVLKWLGCCC